ncbi:MAG TPA: hypothetical protein VGQ83_32880 [Polyangia bacterium]|jgi:hypothetical protein
MTTRLEEFLADLPAQGVAEEYVPHYRTALEAFEESLGRAAAAGRFSKYEVNRFLTQRQRAGASEQDLKNLTTACEAYLAWATARAPAPAPLLPETAVTAAAAADPERTLPPWLKGRVHLIGLGVVVLLLALVGSCVADQFRGATKIRAFSEAVRLEGKRVRDRDRDALRRRVVELAAQHRARVKPEQILVSISDLGPGNMSKLPPAERMDAIAALQSRSQPVAREFARGGGARPAVQGDLLYVEIDVLGEAPGLLGAHKIDFEHHLMVDLDRAPPP